MATRDAATIVRLYDEGNITENEALWQLVRFAGVASPEQIATELPADFLLALWGAAAKPPATVQQTPRIFAIVSSCGATSSEERLTNERFLTFEGLWRWHRYFQAHPPSLD